MFAQFSPELEMTSCIGDSTLELSIKEEFVQDVLGSGGLEPLGETRVEWGFVEELQFKDRPYSIGTRIQTRPALGLCGKTQKGSTSPIGSQICFKFSNSLAPQPVQLLKSGSFSQALYLKTFGLVSEKTIRSQMGSSQETSGSQRDSSQKRVPRSLPRQLGSHKMFPPNTSPSNEPRTVNRLTGNHKNSNHMNIIEVEEGGTTYKFLGCSAEHSLGRPISLSDIEALKSYEPGNSSSALPVTNPPTSPVGKEICSSQTFENTASKIAHHKSLFPERLPSKETLLAIRSETSKQELSHSPQQVESLHRIRRITIIPNNRFKHIHGASTSQEPARKEHKTVVARSPDNCHSFLKLSTPLLSSIVQKYVSK